jgi:hypothetical protein
MMDMPMEMRAAFIATRLHPASVGDVVLRSLEQADDLEEFIELAVGGIKRLRSECGAAVEMLEALRPPQKEAMP